MKKKNPFVDPTNKHRKTSYNPNIWMHYSVDGDKKYNDADASFLGAIAVLGAMILFALANIYLR